MRIFLAFLLLSTLSCAHTRPVSSQDPSAPRKISSAELETFDYPNIFLKVRETLKLDATRKRSAKSPNEISLIEVLQKDTGLLSADQQMLFSSVASESQNRAPDLTKHLRLIPPSGQPGYSQLKFYANHPYYRGSRTVRASNLVEVWRKFLSEAKKQIILNVFDFDLQIIAQELVQKAQQGVVVRVGIDKNTAAHRPEVAMVRDMLRKGGVLVTEVDPVALNHQKVAAIDWEDVKTAKVLFSSGNLTQSCLGPEGDLVQIPANRRPKSSIPNANHVLTMNSWVLANLVHHELTKTLDPQFLYRGSQYPISGAFQVTGPGVDPNTLEAYPEKSLIIAFTPGGAYKSVNKNIIAYLIRNTTGPIRMTQFAYSSNEVSKALLERAQRSFQEKGSFDFKGVGDTPFAMQFWSQFLKMSGLDVEETPTAKSYKELPTNQWNAALSPQNIKKVRSNVYIAPPVYGNSSVKVDGKSYPLSAKIHHKILSTGPFAIVGTSFNFSEGAETNNEQILVFKDKDLVKFAEGITTYLIRGSGKTVYAEAMRRNKRGEAASSTAVSAEDQVEQSAADARSSTVND